MPEIKRESIEEIKRGSEGFIILSSLYFCGCLDFSIIKCEIKKKKNFRTLSYT